MLALKKASFLFDAHFSFEAGFFYAAIAEMSSPSAELLKVNVEVDMQPIVPIHLHTPDQAAHNHFL